MDKETKAAYRECQQIAVNHYENFPVVSLLLPFWARRPVAAIYAFARIADDYADEGNISAADRLNNLQSLSNGLRSIECHENVDNALMRAVKHTIEKHQLPLQPFKNLLKAFEQDVSQSRYESFDELLSYCQHSAHPLGQLMLTLFNEDSEQNLKWANQICSALQLTNFWQDIGSDFEYRNRVYIPKAELDHFGVTEAHLARGVTSPEVHQLIARLAEKTEAILKTGKPLTRAVSGRLGLQVRITYACAETVLEKLKHPNHNPFIPAHLKPTDWIKIMKKAYQLKSVPKEKMAPTESKPAS